MLKIAQLKVRSLDVDYNEVSWEIEDTSEDVLDYTLQVLRSESMAGPWEAISIPFEDRYLFLDRQKPSFHTSRQLQYKIVVTKKSTEETEEFGPVDVQPDADLMALELRRHFQLLMREFAGRRVWLLPVRTFGQRCPRWNKTLAKRTCQGCRTCFDTGFIRGYLSPIELWMQIDTNDMLGEQNSATGPTQQQNNNARVAYFGPLKPRDVVIEAENKRWRVVSVNQTEHGRSPVHYEIQLHEIPTSDVEYAFPINLQEELKDLALSPSRNFTNPMNLETFEREEIPGIFSLYPTTYTDPDK